MTTGGGAPYYFAHEIGHNLGARHEAANWGSMSLMAPNIMTGSRFSQGSIDQINGHLLHFGSCLELKAMPPSLTNARLNLRSVKNRRMVKFVGSLVSASNEPIAGTQIQLIMGKKTISLSTNELGKFVYATQRNQLKKAVVVYATTPGGEARSETLRKVAA
jgi:Metallo-peptidase family M12B Reprolysin-like